MRYIVNQQGKVIGTIERGQVDEDDLASRGEFLVSSNEHIPLAEAEHKDGKIIRHIKTQEELDAEALERQKQQREALINEKMRAIAEEALIAEGKLEPDSG